MCYDAETTAVAQTEEEIRIVTTTIRHLRRKMRDGVRVFMARRRLEQVVERVVAGPITECNSKGTGWDDDESDADGNSDKKSFS